ncbi:hypothetical protein [Cytobacillus purgationiresistens]|uniref:Uncharacterized protein n=1 Tax=Cytobacillus purgationiresistens TaxID=863449 RepID=A0ABU0ARN3_9BACI|nr:hypothetical protein [Cytobacillus purgationiresistens]MDQ0273927.1 hypothetical protein [Cytobacillus purgationiresistens]
MNLVQSLSNWFVKDVNLENSVTLNFLAKILNGLFFIVMVIGIPLIIISIIRLIFAH